jgi:hypothetical protein
MPDLAQTRDGNFNPMKGSEDRWERSTQRACGHCRRIKLCFRAVKLCHLMREILVSLTRSRGRPFNHDDTTRIAIHFWSNKARDEVWLCQQGLETKILIMTSNLTWLQAAIRKYELCTIAAGFRPRAEWKRRRGLLPSNGSLCAIRRLMAQEICYLIVDEHCWKSVLDRLEGNWLFWILSHNSKWKL